MTGLNLAHISSTVLSCWSLLTFSSISYSSSFSTFSNSLRAMSSIFYGINWTRKWNALPPEQQMQQVDINIRNRLLKLFSALWLSPNFGANYMYGNKATTSYQNLWENLVVSTWLKQRSCLPYEKCGVHTIRSPQHTKKEKLHCIDTEGVVFHSAFAHGIVVKKFVPLT